MLHARATLLAALTQPSLIASPPVPQQQQPGLGEAAKVLAEAVACPAGPATGLATASAAALASSLLLLLSIARAASQPQPSAAHTAQCSAKASVTASQLRAGTAHTVQGLAKVSTAVTEPSPETPWSAAHALQLRQCAQLWGGVFTLLQGGGEADVAPGTTPLVLQPSLCVHVLVQLLQLAHLHGAYHGTMCMRTKQSILNLFKMTRICG